MMKRPKKKIMLIIITTLLISMLLATTVYAAWVDKNIKASYRNVKIFANGKPVKIDKAYEPFITNINGNPTTFVPLRALSEMLGKEVKWTQKDYRIDINDKETLVDPVEHANLQIQLALKENEIKDLKKQVSDLEAKLKEAEKKQDQKGNLIDLEKYLNKEYGYYDKMYFDIRLSEYKGDIDVKIIIDLDQDYSRWNSWDKSDIEYYVEKIVKEIRYDFKDAKISGIIEDNNRTRDKLVDFYTDSRGRVVVDTKGSSSGYIRDIRDVKDIWDMADYLNYEHGTYNKVKFEIFLSQGKNGIEVILDVNERDWNDLKYTEQDEYLIKLWTDINYVFSKDYVGIKVYDGFKKLDGFEFDLKGNLSIVKQL